MTISKRARTVAFVAVVLLAPQSVSAGDLASNVTGSVEVNYSDLDLASAAGRTVLHRRISSATREVCGDPDNLRRAGSIKQLRANKACYDRTFASALESVDIPIDTQARAH